jgi:hypothetical protein
MTVPLDHDPYERAVAAFETALDAGLDIGRGAWIPALLGEAFAAGFGSLLDAGCEDDPEGLYLLGRPAWMANLDADELTDAELLSQGLCEDPDDLLELVTELAGEVEVLARTNDSWDWWDEVCAVALCGWVCWFQTGVGEDRWRLHRSHEESDADGRRRLLLDLAEVHLPAGQVDIKLGDAFDDELRQALRRAAEKRGTAPWDTGDLRQALVDLSDASLDDLSGQVANALATDRSEVLAALRRLRGVHDFWPQHEFDRIVAWNVCWPQLRLRR